MAYAALISLSQIIDQFLNHDLYLNPREKKKLNSLNRNVTTMLTFLKNYSHSNEINLYESQIIDASYRLEDIIESKLSPLYLLLYMNKAWTSETMYTKFETRWEVLHKASRDIEYILKKVMNTSGTSSPKESHGPNKKTYSVQPPAVKIVNNGSEGTNTKVGFDQAYVAIKDQMYQKSSDQPKIIPIFGMGGVGKSTLARRIYEDSIRMQYFDRCVWVVVSQEYSHKEILLGVLRSIKQTDADLSKNSISKFVELIHKELFGRRYLIVLDDVWSEKAWDDLNMMLPKNANGSCVLLTTRLSYIATYFTSTQVHELHLLSDDESWILLKHIVFGTRSIPSKLEISGKKIAKECRGLPLTIVVVAGLLKGNMANEYWESISQNISSREPTIELCCSKVLSLSYDHLPIHLKPCFLYVAVFPEDSQINADRLIRLWVAEGFVQSSGSKCSEEVAEEYLNDLVGRSILLASKRRYDGRIKTVGIHDLLRDVGTLKAREGRFHYHGLPETVGTHDLLRGVDILKESNHRRLSIHTTESLDRLRYIRNPMTRSLLIFLSGDDRSRAHISNFTMLRVLDAPATIEVTGQERLVHLRYLAFMNYKSDNLNSWSKLPNLQTLIIHGCPRVIVPHKIWMLPSLRHLILGEGSYLEKPKFWHAVQETNLVTLSVASSLEMDKPTTKILANLRKLGLRYYGEGEEDWENSQFSNIVRLEKLEELKIIFDTDRAFSPLAPMELAFPPTLMKLSLYNTQRTWRDMSIVGSLPNLEVLKLRCDVSTDKEWNPNDGQFLKLKYLEFRGVPLRHWEADSYHFPSLEVLSFKFMGERGVSLEEIPSGPGEINTLRLIQLLSCEPSLVDSAMQIRDEQRYQGNGYLQVIGTNNVSRFSMVSNI